MADDLVVGRKRIAAMLNCSPATISRRFAAGDLPGAFKIARTSPLRMTVKALGKLQRGKGRR